MLKKTCAIGGLVITMATGALLAGSGPASADGRWGGFGFRHYSSNRFFSHHRNFNANENELFNHIRLRIHNRNNNIAIARNDQAQAQRQREDERQFQRLRNEDDDRERPGV